VAEVVPGLNAIRDLALGEFHTCVLAGDGFSALCWGENNLGQLGNNSINNSSSPVLVSAPIR
jgi:alpha-tubulin suppressor-like RCC1 family protein